MSNEVYKLFHQRKCESRRLSAKHGAIWGKYSLDDTDFTIRDYRNHPFTYLSMQSRPLMIFNICNKPLAYVL